MLPTSDSVGVVAELLAHPAIRKLSFTGSTQVGRDLARKAADGLVRASLELGGNALVIAPSADAERAVAVTMAAKFGNSGQACTAANRVYVPRERVEETGLLVEAVSALAVGTRGTRPPRSAPHQRGPPRAGSAVVDQRGRGDGRRAPRAAPRRALRGPRSSPRVDGDEIAQAELFRPHRSSPTTAPDDAVAQANATLSASPPTWWARTTRR